MRHLALTCKAGLRSLVKSEESSVGGQSAASATLPPGVRRPDSYTFRVVSETDTVAHLVRIRVGRVPDLMRFALCRTNRLRREASATMYVVGALAFAFVEEWNCYPLGSFLFALFVCGARVCFVLLALYMRVEVDSQSFGRCVGVPWRLCCVILSYHSSSRLRLLAR